MRHLISPCSRDMCRLRERIVGTLSVIRWMNRPPRPGEEYPPTKIEHVANIITHMSVIIPSYKGTAILVRESESVFHQMCAILYGCALVGLFVVSSTFHSICATGCNTRLKSLFHRLDRSTIHFFIAASYTPWLALRDFHTRWDRSQIYFVWILCVCGILFQRKFHGKYKTLSVIMYCAVALFPILTVLNMNPLTGIYELALGGLIYLFGVSFYKLDGHLPLAHALWHICVNLAAYVHFMAMAKHLYKVVPEKLPAVGSSEC